MIFVTVGTNEARFDRFLRAVERIPRDDLVVQAGASPVRPRNAKCVDYMAFDELVDHVRACDAVIMHAGAGSIMTALANGKTPIVVPRLRRFREAVDDHQVEFGRRLAQKNLVVLVEEPDTLATLPLAAPSVAPRRENGLASDLRSYLLSAIGSDGP